MKKQIFITALALGAIVLGTNNVQAQAQTATTQVRLILSDVIAIDGTSVANGGVVDFNYVTAADYYSTKTVGVANSLKVTSTKPFNIKVKAAGTNFSFASNNIPVNVLTIQAATASGTMGGTKNSIVLSATDQTLIDNAPLGSALTLNLDYIIPAAKSSSTDILGKPAGTYTQTVTYTATAI